MDAVSNEVPLSPPNGLPGWTVNQIARLAEVNSSTVYRWLDGVTVKGHALKLATSIDENRPHLGRFVTTKEWGRFWAAYTKARKSERPRKKPRPRRATVAAPLAGAA